MSDKTHSEENENLETEAVEADELNADAETEETQSEATEDFQQKYEEAQAKADQNWDQLVRLQAEMENLRRRSKMDVEKAHKFALEKFANELLPVKDSLELGLQAASDDDSAEKHREGTELTLKMLTSVMEKFGIVEVDPSGESFNPELHQAMTMQESPDHESNTVIAVMQKGYTLNDRLIRPAMVVVSK